jgi:membrane associated rhomboid family serine protease
VTPWVQRLLFANIIAFFVQQALPGLDVNLAFVPVLILVRPWTVITYMFLHGSLTHILFNMLGLYFFGPRVEMRLGSSRFVTLYFISGVGGAIGSLLFAPTSPIIGASAAVYGVMLAFASFWPREKVFIWGVLPVEIRVLVVIATVISLYSGLSGAGGGVAHFAHLGGFVGAAAYLWFLRSNQSAKKFRAKAVAVPAAVTKQLGNWKGVDMTQVHDLNKEEVNRILDKINATGLGSITSEERLFLSNFVPMDDRKPIN